MDELLKYLKSQFYTEIISYLLAIVGFFISQQRNKQYPKLKPLSFFFAAYFLDTSIIFCSIASKLSLHQKNQIIEYADFTETIIEFLAFFSVIKSYTLNVRINKALKLLLWVFLSFAITYFLYYVIAHNHLDQYFLQNVFTVQASFLIGSCAFYYVDLFKRDPKSDLISDPSFWVVTGVAFFMLCTFPFSVFGSYLIKTNYTLYMQVFTIFEVFYWILFLMIIKAYYCKPERA